LRFWDTSALIPLVVDEGDSRKMKEVYGADDSVATWLGTQVECVSALRRKERMGELTAAEAKDSLSLLGELSEGWTEIGMTEQIRKTALRLLAVHPLTAADALQLSAALDWAERIEGEPRFISLDERLKDAASREGLFCP
jgi:predicted nucleic acid-binding protein